MEVTEDEQKQRIIHVALPKGGKQINSAKIKVAWLHRYNYVGLVRRLRIGSRNKVLL